MFKNRVRVIVGTLAAILLALAVALVVPAARDAIFGLFGREKVIEQVTSIPANAPKQIHPGITVHGDAVPVDIAATPLTLNKADYPVDPKQVVSMSDVVNITPEGKLPAGGTVTLTFTIKQGVNLKQGALFVAVQEVGKDWTFVQPTLSKDGKTATVQTSHFSKWWMFFVNAAKMLGHETVNFLESVFLGPVKNVTVPACPTDQTKRATTDNYKVESKKGSAIKTCFARKDDKSTRTMTVTSMKRYPLEAEHPGFKVVSSGERQANFANLSRLTSGHESIIYPGDTVKYSVELPKGNFAKVSTEYDGLTANYVRMDIALQTFAYIVGKLNVKFVTTLDDSMMVMDKMLEVNDCVNAFKKSFGEIIHKCFTAPILSKMFGSVGILMGGLAVVQGVVNWITGEFTSVKDLITGGDKASVTVSRVDHMQVMQNSFAGKWFVHGGSLTISKNLKSAVETNEQGPCNFDKGEGRMCRATYNLRIEIKGNKLKATYTSIDVKDQFGDAPFDIGTDGEIVGKSYAITFVRKGLISRDMNNVDKFEEFGNPFMCNDDTSRSDQSKCGA